MVPLLERLAQPPALLLRQQAHRLAQLQLAALPRLLLQALVRRMQPRLAPLSVLQRPLAQARRSTVLLAKEHRMPVQPPMGWLSTERQPPALLSTAQRPVALLQVVLSMALSHRVNPPPAQLSKAQGPMAQLPVAQWPMAQLPWVRLSLAQPPMEQQPVAKPVVQLPLA